MADVFISYSHVDNESASADDEKGWIDRFELAFSTKLRQLCGATTVVWRDHKIDGSDLLTPTIEENVRHARLFLSILSQSYLESEWCRTELRIFAEAAATSGGLRVGTKSRIIKVLKTPVDRGTESRAEIDISDLIGYPFFRKREDGKYWEYDPVLGQEAREEFHRQVLELAIDTKALLDALKGGVVEPREKPTGVILFLAQTADDLAGDAERLRRELRMLGHTVLPESPYALGTNFEEQLRADLERAHVAIHPVAKGLGAMPESVDRRVVPLQYTIAQEIAARRRGSGENELLRMVWMPPEARTADVTDVLFREGLDADEAVRKCTLEAVKSAITKMIERKREPAQRPVAVAAPSAGRMQIYLIFDQEDAERAQPMAEHLAGQGFVVTLPLFDGDESERRTDHEETLGECDAVIILHASATDFWRRAKTRDLKRAFGHGRPRPFAARALLLCGAEADRAGDSLDPDLIVLRDGGDVPNPAALDPFLEALARSKDPTG
jgi:hypothetical protein